MYSCMLIYLNICTLKVSWEENQFQLFRTYRNGAAFRVFRVHFAIRLEISIANNCLISVNCSSSISMCACVCVVYRDIALISAKRL